MTACLRSISPWAVIVSILILAAAFPVTPTWGQQPENQRVQEFKNFAEKVVPNLVMLTTKQGLKGKVEPRELADGATFAYRESIIRLKGRLGDWGDNISQETLLNLYFNCFIESTTVLPPKGPAYTEPPFRNVRRVIYNGALDRLVTYAALKNEFYGMNYSLFEKQKVRLLSEMVKPEQLFDLNILRTADVIRGKFK